MLDLHRYTHIHSEQSRAHSCMKSTHSSLGISYVLADQPRTAKAQARLFTCH